MKGPQPQNSAVETYFHQPSRSAVLPFHQTKSFRFCFIGNESDACHRGSRHLKPFALSCGKGSVDKASADFSTATSLLKGQGKRERPNRPTNLDFREAQGLCTFDPSTYPLGLGTGPLKIKPFVRQGARECLLGPANLDLREAQGLCKFDPSHAKASIQEAQGLCTFDPSRAKASRSAYFDLPMLTSKRRRASVNSTLRTPWHQAAPTSTYLLDLREAQGL